MVINYQQTSSYPNVVVPQINPHTQTNFQADDESLIANNTEKSTDKIEQLKLAHITEL